jgi:ATP-dependent Clp protease adaptor protein ClpS
MTALTTTSTIRKTPALAVPRVPRHGGGGGGRGDEESGVGVKAKPKTKRPSLYKVLMLNDDYTPMEFVVYVLQRFFNMSQGRAVDIMLTVHNKGVAVVGVYPFEIAETKVTQVMDCARSNQHPLQCTMEKE